MAKARLEIDRLHWLVEDVDHVEVLSQANEVGEIRQATRTPAALYIARVGRPADRQEGELVAADLHVVGGVARV